jgi:hypothetical protein
MSWLNCLMNVNIAQQVAQQFLQFLLAQRKFAEAAELCPELLKVSRNCSRSHGRSQSSTAQLACVPCMSLLSSCQSLPLTNIMS